MTPALLSYIRLLSKEDKKNLSEKVLKTGEEFGTLAKVTLPYVSAFATNHRLVHKEQILEEVVDTILCALSVAYHLDFTDGEVEAMMTRKSEKWAYLQAGEKDLVFPIPYEIHITVADKHADRSINITHFRETCAKLQIKPIILDLYTKQGEVIKDVMTSSTHFGDNSSVLAEAANLVDRLFDEGYAKIRVKIETVPWHPMAPRSPNDKMPWDCYFEAHIPVAINPSLRSELEQKVSQISFGLKIPLHLSKNAFKKTDDDREIIMLTYRTQNPGVGNFDQMVNCIVASLGNEHVEEAMFYHDWDVGKVHKEFSIYDTKIRHDDAWLKQQFAPGVKDE